MNRKLHTEFKNELKTYLKMAVAGIVLLVVLGAGVYVDNHTGGPSPSDMATKSNFE